jgi:hypothetical protein
MGASYPAFFSQNAADSWQAQSGPGGVILVMQPAARQAPERPPDPPAPVRSQMREYSWPAAEGDGAPAFAIVLKDGPSQEHCWFASRSPS